MTLTLLHWLEKSFPTAKRTTLRRMLQAGRVRVNGRAAKSLKQMIGAEDQVVVVDQVESPAKRRVEPPFGMIYEDADILVVNKPAGLLTATVPREPRPTLLAYVWEYVRAGEPRARVGLIHRLDRDASGLLIFSKNDHAYASLKRQFFKHAVHREYTAIVHGLPNPPAGRIETHLVERTDGTVHSTREAGKGERAVTDYETVRTEKKRSLLKVVLQTGRKHQIRVHLSERGTPIVGDRVYGPATKNDKLLLAATKLSILHPRDERKMTFSIEPPPYFNPL
jgi:23S rRNA pseudouridine1911/1915/1917 synthase